MPKNVAQLVTSHVIANVVKTGIRQALKGSSAVLRTAACGLVDVATQVALSVMTKAKPKQ